MRSEKACINRYVNFAFAIIKDGHTASSHQHFEDFEKNDVSNFEEIEKNRIKDFEETGI